MNSNLKFKNYFILFNLHIFYCSLCQFPPWLSPALSPLGPTVNLHTVAHVHGSFIHVLCLVSSPSFLPYPPPRSPLVPVSLFLVSMPLLLFCQYVCFIDQVPLIGEIIWYLSFATWLISLSIILSSSIHAVEKGRGSFFLLCSIPQYKCTIVF